MDTQVQLSTLQFREPERDASTSPVVPATIRQPAGESARAKYSSHPTSHAPDIWKGRQKNRPGKDEVEEGVEKFRVVLNSESAAYEFSSPRMLYREEATTSSKRVRW